MRARNCMAIDTKQADGEFEFVEFGRETLAS
jgi:hypothetical protein